MNRAHELLETRIADVKEIAERVSREAWNKAIEQSTPYLDRVPELRQILNDSASKFISAGAATFSDQSEQAKEIFARLKEARGDSRVDPAKAKELKDFVLRKAKQAEEEVERAQDNAHLKSEHMDQKEK